MMGENLLDFLSSKICLLPTAALVAETLEQQDEAPLEPFFGPPRPLASLFTCDEIAAAARSLKNGWANGPDEIPNEILKYSSS